MQLETLNMTALVAAAVVVIAREQTKWIHSLAIAQLVLALLLALLAGNYLRLPIDHVETLLTLAAAVGWLAVIVLGNAKTTLVAATVAAWVAGVMCMTELGWVKVDALRRFLRF